MDDRRRADGLTMDAQLRAFAELCRRHGFSIGPGEFVDGVRAATCVGLEDEAAFRAALQSCWVRRAEDQARFRGLFGLFFSGMARFFDRIDRSLAKGIAEGGFLVGDELEMVLWTLRQAAGQMSPLARAALEGDAATIARLFMDAALRLDPGTLAGEGAERFFARRLLERLDAPKVRDELEGLARLFPESKDPARPWSVEWRSVHVAAAMRKLEDAAREWAKLEAYRRAPHVDATDLSERPLQRFSLEEMAATQLAAERLAARLKARMILKDRSRRRGVLSVRRTLRANLSWGAVPARLVFRSKRPHRPEVVILCDVSDSVRNVSRMMLAFVHTFQSRFQRVRTFLFVSDVAEVTQPLREADLGQALDRALAMRAIGAGGNSNYGRVFGTLAERHREAFNRRTTVLVIGDGRCNWNDPNVEALRAVRRQVRRVTWIAPEPRSRWAQGDCELHRYAPHCDQIAVVETLSDLAKVADRLIPKPR